MENKFYIDDFERYLKEKADEFKMYPSKRVWNSIYNNMHPGSRWPSISTCILLIGTLFLVGFLNTATTVNKSSTVIATQITAAPPAPAISTSIDKPIIIAENNAAPLSNNQLSTSNNRSLLTTVNQAINGKPPVANTDQLIAAAFSPNTKMLESRKSLNIQSGVADNIIDKINRITEETIANEQETNLLALNLSAINYQSVIEKNSQYETITEQAQGDQQIKISVSDIAAVPASNQPLKPAGVNNELSEADKFWIENYALYNRPAPKKWKGKLSRQFYFTPSVVYRSLENTAANKGISTQGFINNSEIDNAVSQTPSFGLEIGTSLQYDLLKKFKIKAGIQLNFTRYNSHAFDNGHPIATSLTMLSSSGNSAYEVYRISPYNSAYGITPVKLHNQTYQLSIPIGADYKIAAVDNIEWYAGATIQPTFLLAGRSYLISTDRRNYVKESDMLNRFNLNASFETYLSIKTKGLTWQIGPQFRKQLFSTNDKTYSIEEKLLNYGLKIGVVKKL
jgi:hypothetical protein